MTTTTQSLPDARAALDRAIATAIEWHANAERTGDAVTILRAERADADVQDATDELIAVAESDGAETVVSRLAAVAWLVRAS